MSHVLRGTVPARGTSGDECIERLQQLFMQATGMAAPSHGAALNGEQLLRWDSLAHVRLCLAIEASVPGLKATPERVAQTYQKWDALVEWVTSAGAAAA